MAIANKKPSVVLKSLLSTFMIFSFLFTVILLSSCEKKSDKAEAEKTQKQEVSKTETAAPDTAAQKKIEKTVPDLTGKWSGKFDQRTAVLNITKQTDTEFTGTLRVSYRQPLNQEVSGKFDTSTLQVTMKDLLHSRNQGRYAAKLSADMNALNGTFTKNLDGQKFNFHFTKK